MDGTCNAKGCTQPTFMGWRPLTERLGRQICEGHWRRHKDPNDDFDLFEAFGFRRPTGIRKPVAKKEIARCACGRERLPGASSVPTAPKSGNGNERSEPTTNERTVRSRNLLSKSLSYGARTVGNSASMDTGIVRSAVKDTRKSPIGGGKAGTGKESTPVQV